MASFEIAYRKYILPNEGGYSNVPQDKGGETYAGIARNFHPSWSGWPYIDSVKRSTGKTIPRNTKFSALDPNVEQFYRDWWNQKRFGEVINQDLANLLFDYNVNSASHAITAIQRLVGVTADGAMGPKTIAAINAADPAKLHDALKAQRKQFLTELASRGDQHVFYDGWMARIASFPDLTTTAGIGIVGLAVLFGLGYLIFYKGNAVSA